MRSQQQQGLRFEQEILATGELYRHHRLAYVSKQEVSVGFNKQRRSIFYKAKTGFDFHGCRFKTGGTGATAFYFEAKHINLNSLPYRREGSTGSGVKQHQLEALIELSEWGAETFILWRMKNTTYRISPTNYKNIIDSGESFTVDHCQSRVRVVNGFIDYLELL